jgi:hypothetical protein
MASLKEDLEFQIKVIRDVAEANHRNAEEDKPENIREHFRGRAEAYDNTIHWLEKMLEKHSG